MLANQVPYVTLLVLSDLVTLVADIWATSSPPPLITKIAHCLAVPLI